LFNGKPFGISRGFFFAGHSSSPQARNKTRAQPVAFSKVLLKSRAMLKERSISFAGDFFEKDVIAQSLSQAA
jgi:hypothetical protein